jgi:hypothetical protein
MFCFVLSVCNIRVCVITNGIFMMYDTIRNFELEVACPHTKVQFANLSTVSAT